MKRSTANAASDVQAEHKVSVPKEHKVPISKVPGEPKVVWHSDPGLLVGPREEEVRRKAPEMKLLYILSACLTLVVLWGIFRETNFSLPNIIYGSGKTSQEDVVSVIEKPKPVDDLIRSPAGRREAKRFLEKYPYSLGPTVTDWDEKRQDYLSSETKSAGTRKQQPSVYLVSGSQPESCEDPVAEHFLLKFLKNRVDYSRLHGIKHHFYNMADIDEGVNRLWVKLPLIRSLMLERPDVEWIWWVDKYALFTNMMYNIPMHKYKKFNLIIQGMPKSVYRKQWRGLNTGVFLIRNCQWSLDFLEAWARMADKEFEVKWGDFLSEHMSGRAKNLPAEDQSAAVYLLATEKSVLSSKVLMEDPINLVEYWDNVVKRFEEMEQAQWPFITHFAGCDFCSGTFDNETLTECAEGMERAYNFADNQVLEPLGFQHTDLSSNSVKQVDIPVNVDR